MAEKDKVVSGVKDCVEWWVGARKKKLANQLSESMSVNPFMAPFVFDYNDLGSLEQFVDLIVASHLMAGNATGFGKLVDEKILPRVFGTQKLDKKYRNGHPPLSESCFDEIDHLVVLDGGARQLLSLKAGKWTIQLSMAVQLNAAFNEILEKYGEVCEGITVGVIYGRKEDLTDKYDILRGINTGADHNVHDLKNKVSVCSGREFWAWLNCGELATQEWVLEGVIEALKKTRIHETASELLREFKEGVVKQYADEVQEGEGINWYKLLKLING